MILKRLSYYKQKDWYKLLSRSRLKKVCASFYHAPNILLRGTIYCTRNNCVAILSKGMAWKFIFPWRKINWHVLQTVQVHDLVHDFWKKLIIGSLFPQRNACIHEKSQQSIQKSCVPEFLYGLVLFIDMNTYILTEGRDFKAFLKQNYAITLERCYLFTKKMSNMELKMILIVLMEFAYIRNSWTLPQIWWIPCILLVNNVFESLLVRNIIRFFFISIWEAIFLQDLMALEY